MASIQSEHSIRAPLRTIKSLASYALGGVSVSPRNAVYGPTCMRITVIKRNLISHVVWFVRNKRKLNIHRDFRKVFQ